MRVFSFFLILVLFGFSQGVFSKTSQLFLEEGVVHKYPPRKSTRNAKLIMTGLALASLGGFFIVQCAQEKQNSSVRQEHGLSNHLFSMQDVLDDFKYFASLNQSETFSSVFGDFRCEFFTPISSSRYFSRAEREHYFSYWAKEMGFLETSWSNLDFCRKEHVFFLQHMVSIPEFNGILEHWNWKIRVEETIKARFQSWCVTQNPKRKRRIIRLVQKEIPSAKNCGGLSLDQQLRVLWKFFFNRRQKVIANRLALLEKTEVFGSITSNSVEVSSTEQTNFLKDNFRRLLKKKPPNFQNKPESIVFQGIRG